MFWNKKKDEDAKHVLLLALDCELNAIKKWNEETFPDATLGGQLAKLEEEIEEMMQAKNNEDTMKELADVFIVLGGLRRWDSKIGISQENRYTAIMDTPILTSLIVEIAQKMKINLKRVWKKSGDGKFHHEEVKK